MFSVQIYTALISSSLGHSKYLFKKLCFSRNVHIIMLKQMGCKEQRLFHKQHETLNKRTSVLEVILSILRRMTFTDGMLSFNKKQPKKGGKKKKSL